MLGINKKRPFQLTLEPNIDRDENTGLVSFQLVAEVDVPYERQPDPNDNGSGGSGGDGSGSDSGGGWDGGYGSLQDILLWLEYARGLGTPYQPPRQEPPDPLIPTWATTELTAYVSNRLDLAASHAIRPDDYLSEEDEDKLGAIASLAKRDENNAMVLPEQKSKLRVGKGPEMTAKQILTWDDAKLVVLDGAQELSSPHTFIGNEVRHLEIYGKEGEVGAVTVTLEGRRADDSPVPGITPDSVKVLLAHFELAVDANRDGFIKLSTEDLSDVTTSDKPFRFWINDDNDGAGESVGEVLNSNTKDYETTGVLDTDAIKSTRDLEDFARLWIYTQGLNESFKNGDLQLGLKWTNVTGTPKINLYKAYEADGGDEYLKNPAIAAEQIQNEYDNPIKSVGGEITVTAGTTFVFRQAVFANLSEAQPKTFFIFEGAGEGKGQLKIVILKDGIEIGEGPSVWFDLVNVKSMYERAIVTATFGEPWNYAQAGDVPVFSVSVAPDPQGHAFQQPAGETKESLVFVHGWKMETDDVRSFSETMFKRLWWQGYKGRFRVFRWPTYTDDYSFSNSEFMAWKCGAALKSYVEGSVPGASLPSDYTRCLAAHSLGNVVAGSALKGGLVPDRYIMMQAAIASGCYDISEGVNGFVNPATASSAFDAVPQIAVFRDMFSGGQSNKPTPDNASPDWGYRGYLNGTSATKVVNFCNPQDFALTTGSFLSIDTNWLVWQFEYKPREQSLSQGVNFEYRYLSTAPDGQRLKLYRYTNSAHNAVSAERPLADADESMGFLARTRSLPIGADIQAGGIVNTTVNLHNAYGFTDTRDDHSGQFSRTIQNVWSFYQRIIQELE